MDFHRRSLILAALLAPLAGSAWAASPAGQWVFPSIDGGTMLKVKGATVAIN